MKIVSKAAVMALLSTFPVSVLADTVKLSSPDGLISVEGELKGFDGKMLTVATSYGVVKIPADEIVCEGQCPKGVAQATTESIVTESNVTMAFHSARDRDLVVGLLNNTDLATKAQATVQMDADEVAHIKATDADQVAAVQFLSEGDGDITLGLGNRATQNSAANSIPLGAANVKSARAYEIAVKTLAVILGPDTGIETVSHEELARIYAGEITNWSQLGGSDVTIQAIAVHDEVLGMSNLNAAVLEPFGLSVGPNSLKVKSDAQAVDIISVARGGIGIVNLNSVKRDQATPIRNVCDVAVKPSEFAVSTGEYPLSVSTFAMMQGDFQSPVLPRLFDAIATEEMQNSLRDDGYQGQAIVYAPETVKSDRVNAVIAQDWQEPLRTSARDLVLMLLEAKQLSVRFLDGTEEDAVGARVRADFVRLAEAIKRGDYDGQEVLFVGYSETSDPDLSLSVSHVAASSVLSAFEQFSPAAAARTGVSFASSGHGSVGIACSAEKVRGAANVVEVWVRPAS